MLKTLKGYKMQFCIVKISEGINCGLKTLAKAFDEMGLYTKRQRFYF